MAVGTPSATTAVAAEVVHGLSGKGVASTLGDLSAPSPGPTVPEAAIFVVLARELHEIPAGLALQERCNAGNNCVTASSNPGPLPIGAVVYVVGKNCPS